ncbi:MAG: S9 family peptidase [Anaerolineales bacterium]|nr:S9 family peptidase [Anaerolineales bacterium]
MALTKPALIGLTCISLLILALLGCSSPVTSATDSAAQATPTLNLTPPTPTPSPTPPHPLSIDYLRSRSYEGSDFVIERTLGPGSNYHQYIVSYLSDGLKIYALLTVPQGEKPPTGFPVIIFNHGYIPPTEYRTTERYVAYVAAFASNGYIVVKSDYRGHGSSEGRAESAYGSPAYTIDVLNALASARRYPDADPNRVGMWGHSMGGYITLRALVVDPTIRAGVIWAGVVVSYPDLFRDWWGGGSSSGRSGWRTSLVNTYGDPEANPEFWDSLSANSYLRDITAPVQLHHGTGDTTVPYDFSVTLDEEIRAAGRSVQFITYDGDDHNIARNRDVALTISVVFFDAYVK